MASFRLERTIRRACHATTKPHGPTGSRLKAPSLPLRAFLLYQLRVVTQSKPPDWADVASSRFCVIVFLIVGIGFVILNSADDRHVSVSRAAT